jgi:hypothetical protein
MIEQNGTLCLNGVTAIAVNDVWVVGYAPNIYPSEEKKGFRNDGNH